MFSQVLCQEHRPNALYHGEWRSAWMWLKQIKQVKKHFISSSSDTILFSAITTPPSDFWSSDVSGIKGGLLLVWVQSVSSPFLEQFQPHQHQTWRQLWEPADLTSRAGLQVMLLSKVKIQHTEPCWPPSCEPFRTVYRVVSWTRVLKCQVYDWTACSTAPTSWSEKQN